MRQASSAHLFVFAAQLKLVLDYCRVNNPLIQINIRVNLDIMMDQNTSVDGCTKLRIFLHLFLSQLFLKIEMADYVIAKIF